MAPPVTRHPSPVTRHPPDNSLLFYRLPPIPRGARLSDAHRRMNDAIGNTESGNIIARPPASVLIVDDSDVARESLGTFIAAQPGLRVAGVAASGTEALLFLSHTKVDLVLTDLNMPGLNGLELTRIIKAQPEAPRVVVISVQNLPLCRQGAQEAGADGFVAKSEIGVCLCPMLARLFPRT